MEASLLLAAALLGLVEGLTEFIPVSSTGHLILLIELIGFQGPPGKVFEVVIQLGAILAVCWAYRERLTAVAASLHTRPESRAFTRNILLGFMPAAVLGLIFHDVIKGYLFNAWVVSTMLILGGFAIIYIERRLFQPRVHSVESMGATMAIKVGFCQALAMVPGVSRSGATIMGGLVLGLDRRAATEFSFFLAIPTMLGATALDLFKVRDLLSFDDLGLIAIGFTTAFLAALVVVRGVIAFISRHGFVPFAWYRIGLGCLMLAILSLRG